MQYGNEKLLCDCNYDRVKLESILNTFLVTSVCMALFQKDLGLKLKTKTKNNQQKKAQIQATDR